MAPASWRALAVNRLAITLCSGCAQPQAILKDSCWQRTTSCLRHANIGVDVVGAGRVLAGIHESLHTLFVEGA
eukprot:scaffold323708_cov19-Tisochrysis_lutea.AAC.2